MAAEDGLSTAPHDYLEPLRTSLKGCWKLRAGDCRIAFRVIEFEIRILNAFPQMSICCPGWHHRGDNLLRSFSALSG